MSGGSTPRFPRPIVTTGVRRRYTEFSALHRALSSVYVGPWCDMLVVPPLPPKRRLGRFDDAFVEERRRELEAWVNRVAADASVRQTREFRAFVGWRDGEGGLE
ncbi:Phox-like protein [Gonapodya prolifera JEL478]|uniref:Phox-like protein n=1 Tax=Gonapodya prolifera (strain JEL478) TaxID=1344416 RepID=A0A139AZU7_GONPJ|nr:Phox-like protein [Gonapodya prolifera JEL478]|eukprot:KXS22234.1 Phox-like protein [Gonapodya prolifera JEL478]